MFYKEWSSDDMWMPETGLAILPAEDPVPTECPSTIMPYYDQENIRKLESTLRKVDSLCQRKRCSVSLHQLDLSIP